MKCTNGSYSVDIGPFQLRFFYKKGDKESNDDNQVGQIDKFAADFNDPCENCQENRNRNGSATHTTSLTPGLAVKVYGPEAYKKLTLEEIEADIPKIYHRLFVKVSNMCVAVCRPFTNIFFAKQTDGSLTEVDPSTIESRFPSLKVVVSRHHNVYGEAREGTEAAQPITVLLGATAGKAGGVNSLDEIPWLK